MMNAAITRFFRASVIGLGYIGLPTAAILASRKIKVIGVDVNLEAINTINRGAIHFIEPELDILVHAAVTEGFLHATLTPEAADVFLIAVPTPFKEMHQPDLSYIEAACQTIAPVLQKGNLVILESTSPVGATEQMALWLAQARPDLTFPASHKDQSDIRIAYCPERVLPGHVLHELVHNDRIIGGLTPSCSALAKQFYKLFVDGECIITDSRTAELCKLTENSFRDVNIAFANELSMVCDKLNINVWELIKLANRHPRVNILQPGPGVGGHCIAVDPWFIVNSTPEEAKLIATARQVNDSKPMWVVEKVQLAVAHFLQTHPTKTSRDITIACFGLTFKANIDDLRESPSLEITQLIAKTHPGHVVAVEPNISELPACLVGFAELQSIADALVEADILLMLVDHQPFKEMPDLSNQYSVVDVRGIWSTSHQLTQIPDSNTSKE